MASPELRRQRRFDMRAGTARNGRLILDVGWPVAYMLIGLGPSPCGWVPAGEMTTAPDETPRARAAVAGQEL
jgi:hypothetical protein